MKAATVKIWFVLLAGASLSVFADAAISLPNRRPTMQGSPISTSGDDILLQQFQNRSTAIHFSEGFLNEVPSESLAADAFPFQQTARTGAATSLTILVGFLCVSLTRDRRLWMAAAYLLLTPVAAEMHHLENKVKNICMDNGFQKAAGWNPLVKYNLIFSTNKAHPQHPGLNAINKRASFGMGKYEACEPSIPQAVYTPTFDNAVLSQSGAGMTFARTITGRWYTPDLLSRPPPA